MSERSEAAAKFLAEEIWKLPDVENRTIEEIWLRGRYRKVVRDPLGVEVGRLLWRN